jgi:hypothetical protein
VTVGALTEVNAAILAAVDEAQVSPLAAEKLLGYLAYQALGRGGSWWKSHRRGCIATRREAELRSLGVCLAPHGQPTVSEVPIGAILNAVRDAWIAA